MAQLSRETGNIDTATAENEAPCIEGAFKNGACIDGMVSQQSWLCSAL
ncbi:MAG TPA: hypothetical protein VH140_01340 [Candidatus Acidoferrum sp.]|jgi:hypothetical protein|nr:hypothetical protein [Candidatus Acidoferrum sp.]